LRSNARAQAESELIALAENLDEDSAQQEQVGDLFVRTLDYERAFAAYRLSLKADRHNQAALAGAGLAAFELGRYPQAHRYLQSAVAADAADTQSASLLKTTLETTLNTTDLVLKMDPFQRQISMAQRNRIVVEAFATAGERIKRCGSQKSSPPSTASQPELAESWTKMKPRVTLGGLQRDPDIWWSRLWTWCSTSSGKTSATCGAPTGTDLALLLIAKLHEGS